MTNVLRYIFRAAWTEASKLARAIYLIAVAVPGGLTIIAGRTGWTWIDSVFPWWGWLLVSLLVALGGLLFEVSKRAHRLDEERSPRTSVTDIQVWGDDERGEQFVRVRLSSLTSIQVVGLKARLSRVSDKDGALQAGERLNRHGDYLRVDFPIQLFTQERLRERIAGGDKFMRPFNLDPFDEKWIEVFQLIEDNAGKRIAIYNAAERHELITPDDMTFDCQVIGPDVQKLEFSVNYLTREKGGFEVSLLDASNTSIKRRKYCQKTTGWRAAK